MSSPRGMLYAILLCFMCALGVSAVDYSVTDYIVSGSGCPSGSVDVLLSTSGKALSVVYSTFLAQAGKGFTYSDARKNCQITLNVQVPAGYQFSFTKANYSVFYSLASGTTAIYTTTSYFQASLDQGTATQTITGPASDSNQVSNTLSPNVWSPCGKNSLVNVNSVVRLSGSNKSSSQVTLDSLDIPEASFVWRAC